MSFRDILGVVCSVKTDEPVLAALEALSGDKRHVTALMIEMQPEAAFAIEGMVVSNLWTEIQEQARADFAKEKAALDRRCREALALPIETRAVMVPAMFAGSEAAVQARRADITVMLRPAGAQLEDYRTTLFESILFGSGRPVLLIPPKWQKRAIGSQVVVGWNGKREASRAIADAMPFLEEATRVNVVTVDARADFDGVGEAAGADIVSHLARHGVGANLWNIDGRGREEGDALLAEAKALEADLIVIGGYGKARLREWVFGGVTRALIQRAEIPVLLSH